MCVCACACVWSRTSRQIADLLPSLVVPCCRPHKGTRNRNGSVYQDQEEDQVYACVRVYVRARACMCMSLSCSEYFLVCIDPSLMCFSPVCVPPRHSTVQPGYCMDLSVDHATLSYSSGDGRILHGSATIVCHAGFLPVGVTTATCQTGTSSVGDWSAVLECKRT